MTTTLELRRKTARKCYKNRLLQGEGRGGGGVVHADAAVKARGVQPALARARQVCNERRVVVEEHDGLEVHSVLACDNAVDEDVAVAADYNLLRCGVVAGRASFNAEKRCEC